MDNLRVGGLLRKARMELELPLRVVAKKLDVSIPYLSGVERGTRKIAPARLRKLVDVLQLSKGRMIELFTLRGRLPPKVEKRTLNAPKNWGEDW